MQNAAVRRNNCQFWQSRAGDGVQSSPIAHTRRRIHQSSPPNSRSQRSSGARAEEQKKADDDWKRHDAAAAEAPRAYGQGGEAMPSVVSTKANVAARV